MVYEDYDYTNTEPWYGVNLNNRELSEGTYLYDNPTKRQRAQWTCQYLSLMAKPRSQYVCSDCGTTTSQWVGKCPGCKKWNTLSEEVIADTGRELIDISLLHLHLKLNRLQQSK